MSHVTVISVGMYGEWLRVTPAELREALAHPDDAYGLVTAADEPPDDIDAIARSRRSGTDKTWHALAYLLERADFPVDIITGEQSLVDDPDDSDVDWGYGPPGYLTPDQVRQAASALAEVTPDGLLGGVDPADLARAGVYPNVWDDPDELTWAVHPLPAMRAYFAAAARNGDAMICWIG